MTVLKNILHFILYSRQHGTYFARVSGNTDYSDALSGIRQAEVGVVVVVVVIITVVIVGLTS